MASVVAHLTRVRPAEGASDQDQRGPGASEPSRRTAPAMCSAPPGRVGRLSRCRSAGLCGAWLSLREGGGAVRSIRTPCAGSTAVAGRPEEEAVMPNPVDLEPQAQAVVDANADPPYLV